MNKIFRIFTFAATMAGATVSATAGADETMSVGDLPSYGGTEFPSGSYVDDHGFEGPDSLGVPFGTELEAPLQSMPVTCGAEGCTTSGCQGGCSGRNSRRRSGIGSGLDRCQDGWAQAEFLMWFPRERRSPTLAASAPAGTILPNETHFGNNIDSGLATGFRFDAGRYFADGQFGVGGRIWFLFDQEEGFQTPTGGPPEGLTPVNSRNYVVPFQNIAPAPFDTAFGLQVSRDPSVPGPGPVQGNLDIDTDLQILGSELYGKLLVGKGSQYRLEMIGGYSYFNIEDSLSLRARVVPGAGNPGFGTETSFADHYDTENHFHGGQIGFQSNVSQGRWSFTAVNKVHLGNMDQRVRINGSSQTGPFGGAPVLIDTDRGLFSEDETFSRDTFTFAPEMNFKLAYQMRNHVSFSVGYSLIYWDSVALAGEQIDPVVDARRIENLALADQEPEYVFQDSAFFVQGIDLGVTVDY